MFYKLFRYVLEREQEELDASQHRVMFWRSRGFDNNELLAEYRGRSDAILMHVRGSTERFSGLVGKHSTSREITKYKTSADEVEADIVRDDDYPHAHFLCIPALKMIACQDANPIFARSAIGRLHAVLIHRAKAVLSAEPVQQDDDLRFAVSNFRVQQIDFDIRPVNPHTGDLGRILDTSNKKDHVTRMRGRLESDTSDGIKINGGTASQIQQLQESGHARVGYRAEGPGGVEIAVPKPKEAIEADKKHKIELPDLRLFFPNLPLEARMTKEHLDNLETVMKIFSKTEDA